MRSIRRASIIAWLVTTAAVGGVALLVYGNLTRVPELAGRTDPASIFDDPEALFEDPGLLGSAVEMKVTETVRACMAAAGFDYRGPAQVEPLDDLIEPESGYGIAAGVEPPGVVLGEGGTSGAFRPEYEEALYGTSLDGSGGGGCAAAGRQTLDAEMEALGSLPYSLDRLQADILAHPAAATAMSDWSSCMADKGYQADSPADLIADLTDRLSRASGDAARALAEEERQTAADDRECRRDTLDPALEEVAADLAPTFVERNRAVLTVLVPDAPLGSGDVQVTLRWEAAVDMDLQVTDPAGAIIDYSARLSPSGGQLDRDANYPCDQIADAPVENIFWPSGGAPQGGYTAQVIYRTSCGDLGSQTVELTVRVGGRVVIRETPTLDPGDSRSYQFEFGS